MTDLLHRLRQLDAEATVAPWYFNGCELIGMSTVLATFYWHSGRDRENEGDKALVELIRNSLPEIIAALSEQGENSWQPIGTFTGEGAKDSVIVAVICPDREPVIGEAYWNPEAYGGTWWWAGTSHGDYHADPIEDCNFGRVAFWQPMPSFHSIAALERVEGKSA